MLLNETETAKALNVTKACLRRWRREARGLPFVRVGRLVRYDPRAVSEFILAHTQGVAGDELAKASRQAELERVGHQCLDLAIVLADEQRQQGGRAKR